MEINNFNKERNKALLSLDKDNIIKFMKKYNPNIKIPEDEKIFWAGVHKSICNLYMIKENKITTEQFLKSQNWLENNGFNPNIY